MKSFRSILLLQAFAVCISAPAEMARAQTETDEDFVTGPDGSPGNETSVQTPGVSLGEPAYGGSGCPQGSVGTSISPDGKTLSLLFDAFIVQAGLGVKRGISECTMQIPFRVPNGMQAAVTRIDYRGFNYIPKGGKTHFKSFYFVADSQGRKLKGQNRRNKVFRGPLDEEYFISSKIRQNKIWSNCGEDFTLHVGNQIVAQNQSREEELITTIDTSDVVADGKARYHIQWQNCTGSRGPGKKNKQK